MEDFSRYLKYEGQTRMRNRDTEITGMVKLYSFKVPPLNEQNSYVLPPWLRTYVDNALYALTDNALATINYLFFEAVKFDKCNYFNGYDTVIRDELYGISNEIVNKAIYLLTDYYFDPDNNYYVSPVDTLIDRSTLKKMVLYQLWAGRTGRGLQKRWADISTYDNYYVGQSYYQNDFWLKRVLDNEEIIKESTFDYTVPYIDEADEVGQEVELADDQLTCTRFDMTFVFYQKTIQKNVRIINDFESNFENDIPERQVWKYKVLHYNNGAALRMGLNALFYDVFGDEHPLSLNTIYDFKYSVDLIKPNTGKFEPQVKLLKRN